MAFLKVNQCHWLLYVYKKMLKLVPTCCDSKQQKKRTKRRESWLSEANLIKAGQLFTDTLRALSNALHAHCASIIIITCWFHYKLSTKSGKLIIFHWLWLLCWAPIRLQFVFARRVESGARLCGPAKPKAIGDFMGIGLFGSIQFGASYRSW